MMVCKRLVLLLWLTAGMAVVACGSSSDSVVGTIRYANQPPIWQVNDRKDIPKPAERTFAKTLYHFDGFFLKAVTRTLSFHDAGRAANINAMGEVPDSTWFTNRIGVRDLSVEEVRRGPNIIESPEQHKPWKITGTKVGGVSVGFIMEDARGEKFLLKFDTKGAPELQTGTDIIVQRILHSAGYNVPQDFIVYFERDDVKLAEDATVADFFGNERPMKVADLDDNLAKVNIGKDGRIRAIASKFLPGEPVGGYPRAGRRVDDPNDPFPVEKRREVRGQVPFFAWLLHTDVKEDNTLDMWQEDPEDPNVHYLVHYLVDFDKALGALGYLDLLQQEGYAHIVDFEYLSKSFFSFGLWKRPWEDIRRPELRGVGLIESQEYQPGLYKTHSPYFALKEADRFDGFWASKILMRFTPQQLRAAVEEARFSDPRATDYLTRVLIERQRKTADHWFELVNPLDAFELEAEGDSYRLCFEDLLLKYDLDAGAYDTTYRAAAYDWTGRATGWRGAAEPGAHHPRTCLGGIEPGPQADGYVIIDLTTHRADTTLPPTQVHLALDPATRALRVVGIRRR